MSKMFYAHDIYFLNAATAGSNKAASSSTTLNTRKLDEDTENLSRKFELTL